MPTLRPETPDDYTAVRHVNEQAFGRPGEANLVEALRRRESVALSLVATQAAHVVGHILFSPIDIVAGDTSHAAVALGPMAVMPTHQRQGIGSRLVRRGLDTLRVSGSEAVIVLGHPEYYPRFGFTPASGFGIACPYDVPDEVFMALELQPGALQGKSGTVRYQPEFDVV